MFSTHSYHHANGVFPYGQFPHRQVKFYFVNCHCANHYFLYNCSHNLLFQSAQAFLQHRDLKWAEENRDYVITGMLEALKTIALLADGEDPDSIEYGMGPIQPGEVITNFRKFQVC